MSSQPPEPPPDRAAHEPDAETARVPVESAAPAAPASGPEPAPTTGADPAAPPAQPAQPQVAPGLISAQPVGSPPEPGQATGPPGGPVVAWAPPATPAPATPVAEGLVIAGVFTRFVAYFVDSLLLGAFGIVISGVLGLYDPGRDETLALIVSVFLIGVDFLYFVGLWSSGLQATLGMRMLKLRVLGAIDAHTLSANDAVLRWIALSGAVSILGLVPGLGRWVGLLSVAWLIVLLVTTASNPLRQGLHDRWARSVVVEPAPGGSGLAFFTCLVVAVFVGVVLPILALVLAGDQVLEILSQIGKSI